MRFNKYLYFKYLYWRWIQIDNEYGDFKLEYLASLEYNSMIVYPSHYWHNLYMKENWFEEKNRVTLTGFFTTT